VVGGVAGAAITSPRGPLGHHCRYRDRYGHIHHRC
jgi:hypothetical protein